jgi:hypothetical protein
MWSKKKRHPRSSSFSGGNWRRPRAGRKSLQKTGPPGEDKHGRLQTKVNWYPSASPLPEVGPLPFHESIENQLPAGNGSSTGSLRRSDVQSDRLGSDFPNFNQQRGEFCAHDL